MKLSRALTLLPLLALLSGGCLVAVEDQEPAPEESAEQTQQLDETALETEPYFPTAPDLGMPELQGTSTEIEESNRPDPDPWMNGHEPVRPDPDPWIPPGAQSGKGTSSGAKD